jgi:hypothetical protein
MTGTAVTPEPPDRPATALLSVAFAVLAVCAALLGACGHTAGGAPARTSPTGGGPTTVALGDMSAVTGTDVRLAYRVEAHGSATADVTIVIADFHGHVVRRLVLPQRQATNTDLTYSFRCTLPQGAYRYHVEAVDESGRRQTQAQAAAFLVHPVVPSAASVADTIAWLRERSGIAALAVIDDRGRLSGYNLDLPFGSASVVKAMLLVAYLRTHTTLEPSVKRDLARMITVSDNAATDRIYALVGDQGLRRFAKEAGMSDFDIAGRWDLAQITAADQARFFYGMDDLLPAGYRTWVRELLASVNRYRGWGMPQVARSYGWQVYFKDGWMPTGRGQLVDQVVRCERRGVTFAVAVLTDGDPYPDYGVATMSGVGEHIFGVSP